MISSHFFDNIVKNLKFPLTGDQHNTLEKLSEYALSISSKQDEVFIMKGYAGTGKTTLVSLLVNALDKIGIKSVLLAPTGRAAKVLSTIARKPAFTIHKKIYRQKSSKDGFGQFVLNKNLHKNTLFFIDEASMISNTAADASIFGSGKLLDDIVEYVYGGQNCKLVLIGDVAQLPPVGLTLSPALDKAFIENYWMKIHAMELKEVVRQKQQSDILINATQLRQQLAELSFKKPSFIMRNDSDLEKINGEDLVESITNAYDRDGLSSTIVVCRSNKRANKYNEGIRRSILWYETEISMGDLMMVVKNNYFWIEENDTMDFIANGDIFEITRIKNYEELYGYRFANITARFVDYDNLEIDLKIFLETIMLEKAAFSQDENRDLFYSILEDYKHIKNKKSRFEGVRNNPYFNALQVKFAYAVTCHKAQGGQWKNVFVDQGYFNEENIDEEYLRWLYTAITRSTDKLYLVNFPTNFFEPEE